MFVILIYRIFSVTMPLWTFTVGRSMFSHGSMIIPYEKVATFAFSLMPPLLLGLLLQKTCPKISQLMVTILKPLSSFLIVFIIVFATVTNFYLFKLFTAKVSISKQNLFAILKNVFSTYVGISNFFIEYSKSNRIKNQSEEKSSNLLNHTFAALIKYNVTK